MIFPQPAPTSKATSPLVTSAAEKMSQDLGVYQLLLVEVGLQSNAEALQQAQGPVLKQDDRSPKMIG
ncbi:hypothetical protein CW700_06140 [Candidatus Bathyarchaeota archaeon]|nr:MAG: hypothetical protein CW700_06140 [Candidatus Bathyarchaeota archaeon]